MKPVACIIAGTLAAACGTNAPTTTCADAAPCRKSGPIEPSIDAREPTGFDTVQRVISVSCREEVHSEPLRAYFMHEGAITAVERRVQCLEGGLDNAILEIAIARTSDDLDHGPIGVTGIEAWSIEQEPRACIGAVAAVVPALEVLTAMARPLATAKISDALWRSNPAKVEDRAHGFDLVFTRSNIDTGEVLCRLVVTRVPPR